MISFHSRVNKDDPLFFDCSDFPTYESAKYSTHSDSAVGFAQG